MVEIVIWCGIIAGSLLILLVMIIVLLRSPKTIQFNDLIMVALATLLIIGSQYSKIRVGQFIDIQKMEKAVANLQGELSAVSAGINTQLVSTKNEIRTLKDSQTSRQEIVAFTKKLNEVDNNIKKAQVEFRTAQSSVSRFGETLAEVERGHYKFTMPEGMFKEGSEKAAEEPSARGYEPKEPGTWLERKPEIPSQKPEAIPSPKPEIPPSKK